jgi:hypothetical protein
MYQLDAANAYKALWDHRLVEWLRRVLGAPAPDERGRFLAAAAAVDRELAANLELASMWDQAHQSVTFENAEFTTHRSAIERGAPLVSTLVADTYERIAETESAMDRRGPANTVRPEDRALVEKWEGDVREAQRQLRAAIDAPPPSTWSLLRDRLRNGKRASVR